MRQKIRKTILLISLLLFPVTLNFFSPYISIDGAMNGILSGSLILFFIMFLTAVFFGRAWCGWVCPMAGLSEICLGVNEKPVNVRRLRIVRYSIFAVWAGAVAAGFLLAGGIKRAVPLYLTENGISVDMPQKYVIYYGVLALFLLVTLLVGRRGACHSFCWMAPFLTAGYRVGRLLRLPQLRVTVEREKCVSCGRCEQVCPMSIPVSRSLSAGCVRSSDCILCGACADRCGKDVLRIGIEK